jgi:hypothetical protein
MSPEKNPFNYNVLRGGQVDPTSKLYQRSIAGREKLGDYLSRLWNQGADEADVFMAGVKSLMSRGHGYVGAYLDSKNPNRTYTKNEAMAIADAVMSQENIGEHPKARMTRDKTDEGKAARKEANKARGFGPKQAPGAKAMPVGQQRKQPGGRGKGTGSPADPGDRTPDERKNFVVGQKGPVSEWQNVLEEWKGGKATTKDVLDAFRSKYQSRLSDSPENVKKREDAARARRDDLRENIAAGGRSTEDSGPEDTDGAAPETAPEAVKANRNELEGGFDREWKQYFNNRNNFAKKGTIWNDDKQEAFIDSFYKEVIEKGILKDTIEDYIDGLNEGNLDVKDARERLRKLAVDKLGVDPYEGEDEPQTAAAPSPAQPGTEAPAPAQPGTEAPAPAQPEAKAPAQPGAKAPSPAQPEAKAPAQPGPKAPTQPGAKAPAPAQPEAKAPAQPGPKAPTQPGAKAPAPAQPGAKKPGAGLNIPTTSRKTGGGGFAPSSKEERANTVKEVAAALPEIAKAGSLEDFKASLYNYQPGLFGKQGFDTNPDAKPFPAGPEESAPSSDLPGAPSSRPAPPTAKAGQPGQQSMFRADGTTPRTGRGFGSNVPKPPAQPEPAQPEPAAEPAAQPENKGFGRDIRKGKKANPRPTPAEKPAGPETYKQGNIFGKRGYETGQSDNPLEDQEPDPYAKWRGTPAEPSTDATAGTGDPNQTEIFRANTNYKKPTPRPSLIGQRPHKNANQRKAAKAKQAEAKRAQTRAQNKAAKKGTTSSAEYQEFAQSIRSLMR